MTAGYAYYRLPHDSHYTTVQGDVQEFRSCTQLNGQSGFVVAPFQVSDRQPILVIRPDRVEVRGTREEERGTRNEEGGMRLDASLDAAPEQSSLLSPLSSLLSNYHIDFSNFHAQLRAGTFRKIVLARCADEPAVEGVSDKALFLRACQLYPRMFIALVHTPQSGTWLTATPEILLDGDGSRWRTIALAGTVALEGDQLDGEGETVTWSTKNIEEQRLVATYIAECLERFTTDFQEEGPRTVRAANLVHLRSDFTFTLPSDDRLGDLLHALHPTPAVCGLPKREAFDFIIRNEHTPRRYYSGFMGPLNLDSSLFTLHSSSEADSSLFTLHSSLKSTHLYVSLRCMNIEDGVYHLYAGGGLLKDSQEEQEWQETENKLGTMRQVIR